MTSIDLPKVAVATPTSVRNTRQAIGRGARRLCPACGTGALFDGYLKVHDHCKECDEALYHQRADDGPAYITISIVGNLLIPTLFIIFLTYRPSPVPMLIGFSLAAIIGSLVLLPITKGAMIGMQWARRMHGFDETAPERNREGQL